MNKHIDIFSCQGIVLKRFLPQKPVILIFDQEYGIVSLYFSYKSIVNVWPGMVISYNYIQKGSHRYISVIDILLNPSTLSYEMLAKVQRLLLIISRFLQKNIPYKKSYSLLSLGINVYVEDIFFFEAIERWICAVILQDVGYWHKDLFLVINTFFMKLSVLIDSFTQHEVELFRAWLSIINRNYAKSLEIWIETCLNEQVYEEK